jgi:phosphoribosylanthranilate isomerase
MGVFLMKDSLKIKICGITTITDRDMVIAAGVDYFGSIINVPSSLRSIDLTRARILFNTREVRKVAVLVNPDEQHALKVVEELNPTAIQLHGFESPDFISSLKDKSKCEIWKVIHIPARYDDRRALIDRINEEMKMFRQAGAETLMLDTTIKTSQGGDRRGGTGKTFDWHIIRDIVVPAEATLFIAGGIKPDNVYRLLSSPIIGGIDASSGVELYPGKKDPTKVRKFFSEILNNAVKKSDSTPGQ